MCHRLQVNQTALKSYCLKATWDLTGRQPGLSTSHKRHPGSALTARRLICDEHPGSALTARCLACDEHPASALTAKCLICDEQLARGGPHLAQLQPGVGVRACLGCQHIRLDQEHLTCQSCFDNPQGNLNSQRLPYSLPLRILKSSNMCMLHGLSLRLAHSVAFC